jgi:PsbP.
MLKSDGIESRDLTSTESAFVQVATTKSTGTNIGSTSSTSAEEDGSFPVLTREFFEKSILSLEGKYGMYGLPTGIKVQKLKNQHDSNKSQTSLYILSFTTMTPAMRESDRKVFVSTKIIGNGVYMLVTGTTAARFKGQEALLRKVAESFECIEAPKSKIRGGVGSGVLGSGGTVY